MSKETMITRGQNVLMNTYSRDDKLFVEGQGTYLKDGTGKTYLDFISGIATNTLGHAHPGLVEVMTKQAATLMHTSNLFWNQPSIELAEKLVEQSNLDKVFFSNSGSESNEGAIKLARKWGKETKAADAIEIITMNASFHGRTMGSLAATGQEDLHKNFTPTLTGFKYIPFNDSKALEEAIDEKTCAILLETIQGEGGVNPIQAEFVETINKLQKEKNILLIVDEIQTGMGRTGAWFSYQTMNLDPDIITLAKGLGGGFPIGAFLAKDDVASHFGPGDHGTTFGGNPLATAAGNFIVDSILEENLLENVSKRNEQLVAGLEKLKGDYQILESIKGRGLLIGLKLTHPVQEVVDKSFANGLLVVSAKDNVVRLLPPLNVSEAEIEECLTILNKVFQELS